MPFFCIHCRSEIDPKFKACPFCGEPITDFLRRHFDTPIDGKYQILLRLGVGGMGEVYKVLHIHLNAIRVIKLMRSNIASDPAAHERFLREARLATRINHPNVAALFDFSTFEDGSHYMVWEYIEGINLHELIDERGPLSPRYAAELAAQALRGLDAIHRAGIIHRDISPENLMISRHDGEEHVKIIDLGIAKQGGDEADNKTKTGMFVGKWKYCSPEHLGMLAPGERIDGRADIYSFGIVLYEMLTGVPPFQAETPHAYVMQHASERPRPLREVNPSVTASPELEALIFRSLEKDRSKRFATAREFAVALEALIPGLDERAGAQPLPVASEVTDEATRIAVGRLPERGREQNDVATVAAPAPKTNAPFAETLLATTPGAVAAVAEPSDANKRGIGRWLIGIAAIVVLAIAGVLFVQTRDRRFGPPVAQTKTSTHPESIEVSATATSALIPPAAIAPGHLGINAFPWANVTSIRNVTSGASIAMQAPLVTPAPVELAPGTYDITFENPSFHDPITKRVEVKSGDEQTLSVEFADAAQAPLPAFEGAAP